MEERNILWGELVGGLLIVGCSVALVISLWHSLEAVPYFSFLLFTAITASLLGAGEYTLHHWKLESTSRGLLLIALLLTPLNLLVLGFPSAAGAASDAAGGAVGLAVKIAALAGFAALAGLAGRDLIAGDLARGGRLAAIGAVGAVAGPLLASAFVDLSDLKFLLLAGATSLAAQAFTHARAAPAGSRHPRSAFSLVGLSGFATAVALGFLVLRGSNAWLALHSMGMLLPLTGFLVLGTGLWTRQLMVEAVDAAGGGWRTVATAVAGVGLAVMLAGVPLAWPAIGPLLVASFLAAVLLTALAVRFGLAGLHAAAVPCLTLAALVGFHAVAGHLPAEVSAADLARLLAGPESGAVLVGCAVVLLVLAEAFDRSGRQRDAIAYALGAAGLAAFGLLAVTVECLTRLGLAAGAYATCAAGTLAANFRWRRPVLAYTGLGLAVAASVSALHLRWPGEWPLWACVLGGESALLAAGGLWSDPRRSGRAWRDVGLAAGALAVALMATHAVEPSWYAATSAFLAVAALFVAVAGRSSGWFGVCQIAVTAATAFAVEAWLESRPWFADRFDARALQVYGLGLGLVSLAWVVARLALRSSRIAVELGLTGPTVDRLVLAALVAGQCVLAVAGVAPGIVAEMIPGQLLTLLTEPAHAYGPGAWMLLGLLALVLTASLRERGRTSVVAGLTLLALTLPVLAAGPFAADRATASALRWGLAGSYLAVSVLVWARGPLARLASGAGVSFPVDAPAARFTRGLLGAAAAAVLALTGWMALRGFAGEGVPGPLPGSFFERIGRSVTAVVPLAVLVLGMAGHAVRERSPAYAFAGGLVAAVAVAGGYALAVVTAGGAVGEVEGVRVVQLATLAAGLWALGWMLVRRWLYGRAGAELVLPATAGPLLALQIGLTVVGNILLLGGAVALRGNVLVQTLEWSKEAGSALGAAALAAGLVASAAWHLGRREPLTWQAPFFAGLTVPVLLACAAERTLPATGYRVLLLAWPGYVLAWSLVALRPTWRRRLLPGVAFDDTELPIATVLASAFTAVTAWKVVWFVDGYVPAATAALITATAFAALAVARRAEGLAFVAALLGNVAVSLVVARYYHGRDLSLWAVTLVRANVIACAVGALAWLTLRRRLPEPASPGPLLAVQAGLGLVVNTLLLLVPAGTLLLEPGVPLPVRLRPDYAVSGWPALVLATAPAYWHRRRIAGAGWLDVFGIAGLSAGVLVACLAARWDTGNWLSYHVLGAACAALGLVGVAVGSVVFALREAGFDDPWRRRLAGEVPAGALRRWVEIACVALAVLALRGGWDDPYRPYPSAAALVLVSVMTAALAMWFRTDRHVWASGLALNLAGVVLWVAKGSGTLDGFLLASAIGLAVAAAFWTGVALALPGDGLPIGQRTKPAFAHFGVAVTWLLVVGLAAAALLADLAGVSTPPLSLLAWPAVAAVAAAIITALWDRSAPWPVAALYGTGLAAAGTALHAARLGPDALARVGTLSLAGYVLLAGLFRSALAPGVIESLRLPHRRGAWFAPAQLVAAVVACAAGLWISVSLSALDERLTGAAAVTLLVPAAALLGPAGRRATFILAALALTAAALAIPEPAGPAPWLHRTAFVLVALVAGSLVYTDALPRLLRGLPAWTDEARRTGAALGVLATVTLLLLLGQEALSFDPALPPGRTPMGPAEIVLVTVCIAALIPTAIRCAVVPGRDLLRLSERGRTAYVYAAEALVVLAGVHLRLTAPELFSGWLARYWTVVVMLLGFAGMGLSDLFERGGLPVLADPLRRTGLALPAVPLAAFWIPLPLLPAEAFAHHDLGQYAVLWLLLALLYGLAASLWRSIPLGLLAAFALNFGLWSLLARGEVAFLAHPQVWLIPPALIVLVAEHLNRDRLTPEVASGLRYLGVCTVYVSSTADLFIAGLGHSVWLPIILAVLAVAGVLAGISLRVRAFLFLGVSFLLLDVLTMIWHAAVDRYQTWVWWVSGIVLGAAILALFAVFEKRRKDVLRLLDDLRRWN
jgi:hypothetical protein